MFDVHPLRAIKRSKAVFTANVDAADREGWWIRKIQVSSMDSCEAEWCELGGAAYS